ncbi:uncharacterized protein LOC131853531 [Achroia grisella]|uniref:uncharacterized protein LOC131853531 n=1 Tax=Achroia grisella TaxID=688607 RepID=UPI0027D1F862|nr:uncharacterized protein LOC131853531 [Achroia grisella]
MASLYDDTVLNFDLDYLHITANNTLQVPSKFDKQRKALAIAKKKTVATNSLIKKYYNKKELLDTTEKALFESKEECKRICIDYKSTLEKCTKLESDIQILEGRNNELQIKLRDSEDHFNATKSHANQLQVLVKEKETEVEALKIENQLDKSNVKTCEKRVTSLERENNRLHDLFRISKEVLLGKKKLNKKRKDLVQNYEKYCKGDNNFPDNLFEEEISDNETYASYDNLMSPYTTEDLINPEELQVASSSTMIPIEHELSIRKNGKSIYGKNDDTDRCSDYSNEVASADTGRGSSLAYSDSEKCFNSPEYCLNDNIPIKCIIDKPARTVVDIGTSPIPFHELGYTITNAVESSNNYSKIPEKRVDRGVSPIKISKKGNKDLVSSIRLEYNAVNSCVNDKDLIIQKQQCLEINNSINYNDDNTRDSEIESILNEMRFPHKLITPIPRTPAKSHNAETQQVASQTDHSKGYVCHEAEKVREENKVLYSNIKDLAKEIMNIKSILKVGHQISPVTADRVEHESLKVNQDNSNICEELVIVIESENSCSNISRPAEDNKDSLINIQQNHTDEIENGKKSYVAHHEHIDDISDMELNDIRKTGQTKDACIEMNESVKESRNIVHMQNGVAQIDQNVETDEPCMESYNTTLSRLEFEDPVATFNEDTRDTNIDERAGDNFEKTFDAVTSDNDNSLASQSESNGRHKNATRVLKLTKLDRFRRKMLPKSKIRKELLQPRNPRSRSKRLIHYKNIVKSNSTILNKSKSNANDSSLTLNDKTIYENAVKVMSELKSKRPDKFKCNRKLEVIHNEKNKSDVKKTIKSKKQKSKEVDTLQSVNIAADTPVITRSRSKCVQQSQIVDTNLDSISDNETLENYRIQERRKRLKRSSIDKPDVECKRMLRSSTRQLSIDNNTSPQNESRIENNTELSGRTRDSRKRGNLDITKVTKSNKGVISYEDLEMFSEVSNVKVKTYQTKSAPLPDITSHPKESILCLMINKYSTSVVKHQTTKISDSVTNLICEMIETSVAEIINLPPNETKNAMNKLVDELQNFNYKEFLTGFIKYLQNPQRKIELFLKVNTPPAPPMTKQEQVLLYIISQLASSWPSVDIVNSVLNNVEYLLFKLNRTPDFDVIESTSHFYAILCRYFQLKTRLRVFILDALYCMQYKAIAVIKQCLDVWMHILPLAHMGIAKNPLVTCLVYVMHFYKCEDTYNRVRDIRSILNRKYSYQMAEWNDIKMLEMFKNAIKDLKDNSVEKKILRISLIIIAKRQGPRWCQKHIITNTLQPIIEADVPEKIKSFCVSMLGPLMKPYPQDMKVHCEIVMNQLLDMLNQSPSSQMEEAIFTSLMYMNKHNQNRVIQALLNWFPTYVSPECEEVLRDFVRDKPPKIWKTILSKISLIKEN